MTTFICIRHNGGAKDSPYKSSALIAAADLMSNGTTDNATGYRWHGIAVQMMPERNPGIAMSTVGMMPAIMTMAC